MHSICRDDEVAGMSCPICKDDGAVHVVLLSCQQRERPIASTIPYNADDIRPQVQLCWLAGTVGGESQRFQRLMEIDAMREVPGRFIFWPNVVTVPLEDGVEGLTMRGEDLHRS